MLDIIGQCEGPKGSRIPLLGATATGLLCGESRRLTRDGPESWGARRTIPPTLESHANSNGNRAALLANTFCVRESRTRDSCRPPAIFRALYRLAARQAGLVAEYAPGVAPEQGF